MFNFSFQIPLFCFCVLVMILIRLLVYFKSLWCLKHAEPWIPWNSCKLQRARDHTFYFILAPILAKVFQSLFQIAKKYWSHKILFMPSILEIVVDFFLQTVFLTRVSSFSYVLALFRKRLRLVSYFISFPFSITRLSKMSFSVAAASLTDRMWL